MISNGIYGVLLGVNNNSRGFPDISQALSEYRGRGPNMEGSTGRSSSLQSTAYINCLNVDDERKELVADPTNVINGEHYMEDTECSRKCSRLFINGKVFDDEKVGDGQLMDDYDSKANVAELSVGIYPLVCVSNGDGIYKPNDEFYNVKEIVIGVITNDDLNAVKDAYYLPIDDTQHQIEPTEVDESEGAVKSIRSQVQSFVNNAAEAFHKLKENVNVANDMLHKMNKPNQKIDENLVSELEDFLTDSPAWCLSVMDGKDRTIELFEREICDLREQRSQLLFEREELQTKLERESSKTSVMSAGDQRKLKALGINNFSDLINRYRNLQGELEASKKRFIVEASLTRGESLSSVCSKTEWNQQLQPEVLKQGGFTSVIDNGNITGVNAKACIPLPMPDKFRGKTRVELERYFRYFDEAVTSRGYDDKAKATIVGNYLPKLQFVHDKLIRKKATYDEIKAGLLNALGIDSSVATFTLRTSLDRLKKSDDKLYKAVLEDVELQVTQAFNEDEDQGEAELKKILIRLTQEDSNPIFGSTIIPHIKEDYTRLKELVLGVEESFLIKKKNDSVFKSGLKPSSSYGNRKPGYQQERDPPRSYAYNNSRDFGDQRDADNIVLESSRMEVQRVPVVPPFSLPNNIPRFPYVCYKCNKPGHYASDCAETEAHNVGHVKDFAKLELNGVIPVDNICETDAEELQMFGKKAMLDVRLDSVTVRAMLDSGACASVISEAAIGKILRQRPKEVRQISQEDPKTFMHKRLVDANGSALNVVNCIRMPIAWGSYPSKIVKFFVVSGLHQDVLIGTNVLQDDACWIEALGIALGYGAQVADTNNERKGIDIGLVAPQNASNESCYSRANYTTVSLYRDKTKNVSLSRDNINNVSRASKNFIVKDGKSKSQRCPKETTTVLQDAKQLQVNKRTKKVNGLVYRPKEPSRGSARQKVIEKSAELSNRGNANANDNVKKCDASVSRGNYYKRKSYFNSNYVFSHGSPYITGYGNIYPKYRGTYKRPLSKSSADVDQNWRNRVHAPGIKRKSETCPEEFQPSHRSSRRREEQ